MLTAPAIVLLEDDARRSTDMCRTMKIAFPAFELALFDNARDLLSWLTSELSRVRAISLDCDLDSTSARELKDAGSGQEIVDYLVALPPTCPVIIHSLNAMRAPGMHMALVLGGWTSATLAPYLDAESWIGEVRAALDAHQQ